MSRLRFVVTRTGPEAIVAVLGRADSGTLVPPGAPDVSGPLPTTSVETTRRFHVRNYRPGGFLRRHLPVGDQASDAGQGSQARTVRRRHHPRTRRTDSPHHRRLRQGERYDHTGDPGGRQDHLGDAADLQGGEQALQRGGSDGCSHQDRRVRKGGLRGRRTGRGARLPPAARVQAVRGLRDRRGGVPEQGSPLLGGQVREVLRRVHRLHGRRLLWNQRAGHGRPREGHRRALRHRAGPRHRTSHHDEGLRRDHPAPRPQDGGESQPDHGGRNRDVRWLPRHCGRQDEVRLCRRARFRRPQGRFR